MSRGRRDAEASADLWPAPRALFPPQSAVRVRSYKQHRDIALMSMQSSKRLKDGPSHRQRIRGAAWNAVVLFLTMAMGKIGIASWPFWLKTRTQIEKTRPTPPLLTERQLPLGGPCKGRVREASRVLTTFDLRDVANFTRRGSIITGESMKENPDLSKKLVDTRIV